METTKTYFIAAVVALLNFTCIPETEAFLRCNTPEELLIGPSNFFPGLLWPNGRVTYELDSSLTPVDVKEVMLAIYNIQDKTCIRFAPRAKNETSYVSMQHDDNVCGLASHLCRSGGPQFVKFGDICKIWSVMVHEIGHILCLAHEMSRQDRDDYVHFTGCSEGSFQSKDNFDLRGSLYDYTSQMAYECSFCAGGFPIMEGVKYCSTDVQRGLSVLDSDKLNDLYDCKECFSHRWRNAQNLTDGQKGELVSFGKTIDLKDLYLCRTYVFGEIAPGQYNLQDNTCIVTYNGSEHQVKERVQVFTVPDNSTQERYIISKSKDYLVPVGRTALAISIYAAFANFNDNDGMSAQIIGKVYANDFCKAYFSVGHVEVTRTKFSILGCF